MASKQPMQTRKQSRADLGDSWAAKEDEDFSSEQDSDYSTSSEEPYPIIISQSSQSLEEISWVGKEDEELSSEQNSSYSTSSEEPTPTSKPQTRRKAPTSKRRQEVLTSMASSEPLLIMPSISEEAKESRKKDKNKTVPVQPPSNDHKPSGRARATRVSHAAAMGMAREEATQPQKQSTPDLGDSWVVKANEDFGTKQNLDYSTSSKKPTSTTRSQNRGKIATPERISRGEQRNRRVPVQPSPKDNKSNGRAQAARVSYAAAERSESIFDGLHNLSLSILRFIFGVIGRTFRLLESPISIFIAACVLYALSMFARDLLKTSIYAAISPICIIPGSSFLLPMCGHRSAINYKANKEVPVHFDQLMGVQSKFEDILEQTAAGIELPLDMKRSEASIRDLNTQVKYSSLNSKLELVHEFEGFIETARLASKDLQTFNSHVGRSVDIVLSLAKWTKRTLQGIEDDEAARGALSRFFSPIRAAKQTEKKLVTQYLQNAAGIEEEIHRLVVEAQALLQVLQNLEDRLEVISNITARDTQRAQLSQAEVLAELWSMLGGNGTKLAKYERELGILRQVTKYRQNAFGYVAGTILQLQAMEAELEGLRERVGRPGNAMGIPLSVHIDNIQLGLERLESGRQRNQRKEGELMSARLRAARPEGALPALPAPRTVDISL